MLRRCCPRHFLGRKIRCFLRSHHGGAVRAPSSHTCMWVAIKWPGVLAPHISDVQGRGKGSSTKPAYDTRRPRIIETSDSVPSLYRCLAKLFPHHDSGRRFDHGYSIRSTYYGVERQHFSLVANKWRIHER